MAIRAVLFDFDGTVANTNRLVLDSWQDTYRTLTGRKRMKRLSKRPSASPLPSVWKKPFRIRRQMRLSLFTGTISGYLRRNDRSF